MKAAQFKTIMELIGQLTPEQRDLVARALAESSEVEGAAGPIKTHFSDQASGMPAALQRECRSDGSPKPSLAVVMTCHNRKDVTLHCLETLMAAHAGLADSIALHIYLLDDGSPDDSGAEISRRIPNVTVIQGTGNLYWTRGMHAAFGRAMADGHDFYLWLNDDVQLFDSALEDLFACHASDYQTYGTDAVIVGTLIDPETHQITYGGHSRGGSKWLRRNERVYSETRATPCESFSGNCVLLPHSVAQSVGNLDPVFHHTFGDHDYGYRCSARNIRIIVCHQYSGYCRENDGSVRLYDDKEGRRFLFELGLMDRIRLALHPKQYPLRSWFTFSRKYLGPLWAFRFFLPYLKAVAPRLF